MNYINLLVKCTWRVLRRRTWIGQVPFYWRGRTSSRLYWRRQASCTGFWCCNGCTSQLSHSEQRPSLGSFSLLPSAIFNWLNNSTKCFNKPAFRGKLTLLRTFCQHPCPHPGVLGETDSLCVCPRLQSSSFANIRLPDHEFLLTKHLHGRCSP